MSNKMELKFNGIDSYMKRLQKMNKDIKKISENALKASWAEVTPNIHKKIKPHYLTGATETSLIKTAEPIWEGDKASIKVGFSVSNGGIASIFLMYGTPTMKPDVELYNAIYGSKTISKVRKIQKEVFEKGILR